MLNKKYKLYSSILALCLTLALMATGVWAILQQSLGVSTTVSFTATSVKGTINGEVEGGYAGVENDYETTALGGSSDLTGAEIVQFGTKYVFANITGTNSSWNGKEAYYVNGVTTEKVGAEVTTLTAGASYTISKKSYVSNFSPTNASTDWTIADMTFQPDPEGQTSAITITLTIENTGSNIIAVSFPDDAGQWSDSMSEATAPDDNLLVSYAISNNGSAFSEPVAFSTINSKSIVSGGITTIKLVVTVQDDSSSIPGINLAFQVKLEKGVDVWGGETASSFAGGSGTELDPYEISNGEQLAYLATLPEGTYYKLTNDIVLNNIVFTFKEDSGLVEVKNRDRTLYLGMSIAPSSETTFSTGTQGEMGTVYTLVGNTYTAWTEETADTGLIAIGTDLYLGTGSTGTVGDASSSNSQFDEMASVSGQFYVLDEEVYSPDFINVWNPIGTDNEFDSKIFDGNGYEISGLYINNTSDNQGLFGYAVNSTIENVGVVDSFIYCGGYYAGNILGYGESTTIDNCYNLGIVSGDEKIGGLVGETDDRGSSYNIINCYNSGTISGNEQVGGLVGAIYETTANNCYNTGNIVGGETEIGGIFGYSSSITINNCYNTGTISSMVYSCTVGGLVGQCSGSGNNSFITNCYNSGNISGYDFVGGLVGNNSQTIIINCYNNGSVVGTRNYVGGIAGGNYSSANIINCYNIGNVTGTGNYVGGLVGENYGSTVMNCYNNGTITGGSEVGGVVGNACYKGAVTNCYNNGTVNGTSSVGGIVGNAYDEGAVTNCYNTGTISGNSIVGGVIGFVGKVGKYYYGIATVTNCYNNGTVNGTSSVGGVAGENDGKGIITNCYYLSTIPTNAIGTNVGGIYTNIGSVTGPSENIVYIMDSDGITTNTSTTTLFQALNTWVTANQTDPVTYRTWTLTGSTNGYPIFA